MPMHRLSVRAVLLALALALAACADPSMPSPDAAPMADAAPPADGAVARDGGSGADADGGRDAAVDAPSPPDAGSDAWSAPDAACMDADGDGDPARSCGGGDCDDSDPTRSSHAAEVCSVTPVDEDCDGNVDEGVRAMLHTDADRDGYGSPSSTTMGCPSIGLVADGTDCDDTRADVSPGASELCGNGIDDDCDGMTDESGPTTFYADTDHDGYGVPGATTMGATCTPPAGWAANAADCDDTTAATHPGIAVDPCNGRDDDCSLGLPGAGVDAREDQDGDHHGNPAACVSASGGYPADDCDDTNAAIHPSASELCDRIDENCSSGGGVAPEEDVDADGHAPLYTSLCHGGYPADDCNDTVATIHPGATEICNRIDDDCSTGSSFDHSEPYEDADGDGHAAPTAMCTGGFAKDDCNDNRATIHPGATETCNGLDDDCSTPSAPGNVDRSEDQDGDFHSPPTATCAGGYALDDCDDTRAVFHPGAPILAPRVIAPAIGAHVATSSPTFRWASTGDGCFASPTWELAADDSCPNAATCDVYMASPEIHATGITTTTYVPTSGLHTGRSFFHVRECNGASGCGPWSAIRWVDLGHAVGDLNGDGHADLAVGASDYVDGTGWRAGRVYVYYGTTSGLPAMPNVTIDPPWSSIVAEQRFGSSLSLGDYDGDGYADLAVAAIGALYLYRGGASGVSASVVGSASFSGVSSDNVAFVGDLQADGFEDIAVGVHGAAYDAVAVFYGTASGLWGTSNVTISTPSGDTDAGFGASVASAGDVDDDGYGDLVVGVPGSDGTGLDAGRVYVFRGSPYDVSTSPSWTIEAPSAQASAAFCTTVAGLDLDGDGFSDVIAGAPLRDGVRADEGRIAVIAGTENGPSATSVIAIDAPGDEMGARFGASIAVGDVTGDGQPDLAVGAPGADGVTVDAGAVFVYAGTATGLGTSVTVRLGDVSGTTGAALGTSVARLGDVDGDGIAELAAGAPNDAGVRSGAGSALVWRGGALASGPTITLDDPSGRTGPHFGTGLARAGTRRRDARETRRPRNVGLVDERRVPV